VESVAGKDLQELCNLLCQRKIFKNMLVLDKDENEIFNYEEAMLEHTFSEATKAASGEEMIEETTWNMQGNEDSMHQFVDSFSVEDEDEFFEFDDSEISDDFEMIDEDF